MSIDVPWKPVALATASFVVLTIALIACWAYVGIWSGLVRTLPSRPTLPALAFMVVLPIMLIAIALPLSWRVYRSAVRRFGRGTRWPVGRERSFF